MRRIASDVGTGEGHERTVGLTEEDLAVRAGTTVQRLRELIAIGILRPGPSGSEPFSEGDALRVQLVEHLAHSGIAPTSVAAAIEGGGLLLSFLDNPPGPTPRARAPLALSHPPPPASATPRRAPPRRSLR